MNNVVISGNRLLGHPLTIDVLPPGKQRRSNWVVTNNVSNTTVRTRPMRFAGIDGLVVSGNTQRVKGKQPAVVIAGDCGAHVAGNQFGTGVVRQHGTRCAAALAMPKAPRFAGRGGSTTTTTVPPVTAPRRVDHDDSGHDAGSTRAGSGQTRLAGERDGGPWLVGVRRGVRRSPRPPAPALLPRTPTGPAAATTPTRDLTPDDVDG